MNLSIYKNKSITTLLSSLRTEISAIQKKYYALKDAKIRFLIKELKTRDLSDVQKSTFNKLVLRYTWI